MANQLMSIREYLDFKPQGYPCKLAEIYGTESFCWFLYSLILMEKPQVVVELGTGVACCSCMAGLAVEQNGVGHVWTVDDGSDWPQIAQVCRDAVDLPEANKDHHEFISKLLSRFGLSRRITLVQKHLSPGDYFDPGESIDLVFADIGDTGPRGCVHLLRYFLPRVSHESSIIIDRASTILPARLLLLEAVRQLTLGRIPASLVEGLSSAEALATEALARACTVQLIDLVDAAEGKANLRQNGRAWIRITRTDFVARRRSISFDAADMDAAIWSVGDRATKPEGVTDL